jgi:heptosyltransferase-2
MERRGSERVLIFLKGGIGDVVFALPLLADLRAGFPGAELVALSHDQGADLLRYAPAVDTVRSTGPMASRAPVAASLRALGLGGFDVAVTPVRSARAAWLLLRSGAPVRVGFGGGPERLLLTHVAPVRPFEVVFSRRFERLATALGLSTARRRVWSSRGGREEAAPAGGVGSGGGTAAGRPPRRRGWPTKRWPLEHCRELVGRLAAQGRRCSWWAAPRTVRAHGDRHRRTRLRHPRPDGRGWPRRWPAVVCRGHGGLDSGLSHAAVALGVPTVLLFGPNDPDSVAPVPHARLVTQALPCRPCNRAGKERCPEGHHRCMRDTTPEQVLAALAALGSPRGVVSAR